MKKYLYASAMLFGLLLPAATSCHTPPYYDNVKKDFPAIVMVLAGDRQGSGVIISSDGWALTGQHVVNNAKKVNVLLNNGSIYEAPVSGQDEASDLAFIKLPPNDAGYPFVTLGDSTESDELQTGSPVVVLGYPAGNDIKNLMFSTGIVCAFRTIESVDYIQSDATVYAGSSGGPMLNTRGDVIGIINSKYTNLKDSCATFATSINTAKSLFARVQKGLPIGAQQSAVQPPVNVAITINNVQTSNITSSGATISWQTNIPTSGGVELGKNEFSNAYVSAGGKPATSHSVQITGLEARTTYRFRITAADKAGKLVYSSIYDLATERATCANVGCRVPGFSLNTTDGRTVSLSSYKGRKVILVFTSAGCSSCAEVMRCIQQIYGNWPREQMEVIVVVSLEKAAEVDRWIKTYEIKTPVVLDPAGDITNQYQPAKMPALYFLDGEGTIKSKKYAPLGGCGREIDALLRLY